MGFAIGLTGSEVLYGLLLLQDLKHRHLSAGWLFLVAETSSSECILPIELASLWSLHFGDFCYFPKPCMYFTIQGKAIQSHLKCFRNYKSFRIIETPKFTFSTPNKHLFMCSTLEFILATHYIHSLRILISTEWQILFYTSSKYFIFSYNKTWMMNYELSYYLNSICKNRGV